MARWRAGDRHAGDVLVTDLNWLVRTVVRKTGFRPELLPYEDLEMVGTVAMLQAAQTYDPSHGLQFSTYAYSKIRFAILKYLRRHTGLIRVPDWVQDKACAGNEAAINIVAAMRLVEPLNETIESVDCIPPDIQIEIAKVLEGWTPKQQAVAGYILSGLSARDYAEQTGESYSYARKRFAAVLQRLRRALCVYEEEN